MFLMKRGLLSAMGSGGFVSVAYPVSSSDEVPNLVSGVDPGSLRRHDGLGME